MFMNNFYIKERFEVWIWFDQKSVRYEQKPFIEEKNNFSLISLGEILESVVKVCVKFYTGS